MFITCDWAKRVYVVLCFYLSFPDFISPLVVHRYGIFLHVPYFHTNSKFTVHPHMPNTVSISLAVHDVKMKL